MDDTGVDDYEIDGAFKDKEQNGVSATVIVSRYFRPTTKECITLVLLDLASSDDFMDSVQVTCDNRADLVKFRGMLVYGGLIYLSDKKGDPIWALFLMENSCELRQYTDGSHRLIEKQSRKLTWADCQKVVRTQTINWLPKLPMTHTTTEVQPAQPFSAMLSLVKTMIHKMAALSPIPLGFQPHQPGTPLTPQPINNKPGTPPLTAQPLATQPQGARPPSATAQPQSAQPQGARPPLAAQTTAPLTGSPSSVTPSSPQAAPAAQPASPPKKSWSWF